MSHPALPLLGARPLGLPRRALPTVQALDALWQQYRDTPVYAPRRIWQLIKLRWQMRLTLLDPQKQQLSMPAGKVNDCSACSDICCIGSRSSVLLRLRDIAVLHDIGKTHLMTHEAPTFSAKELRGRPALRRQVASADWARFPRLKQNHFGACEALDTEGLCGLYPYWPMACARFPYSLHVDDAEIFYSRRCRSFFIHPRETDRVQKGRLASVEAYNERIKDTLLLTLLPQKLEAIGLLRYLR